ncbi:MAG: amidohydrolase family protein [Kiritimatiellae bacterium]|nr:amidohydrolase family protein [Kiritimatiellia bacterium]
MLTDINVSLGFWPFQRFALDSAAKLSRHLKAEGISRALVSSVEAVLYPDPDVYNRLLLRRTKPYRNLLPVPVINPLHPDWRNRLRSYAATRAANAVKIFANYHSYSLRSRPVRDLAEELAGRKAPLVIQMRLEDERNQYPRMKVPGVKAADVAKLASRYPAQSFVCVCCYWNEAISLVREADNVYVDISFTERLNTVEALLRDVPAQRLLFGSHTPFLYARAAVMKMTAARIAKRDREAIASKNAARLFGPL